MARVRVKTRCPEHELDGSVPAELSGPVQVSEWAPELWAKYEGIEPEQANPDWWRALMLARRRHKDAVSRWAGDVGLSDEERRRVPGGRPVWE